MPKLYLGTSLIEFTGEPTWTESLTPGASNAVFAIPAGSGQVTPGDEGTVLWLGSNGARYWAGWFEAPEVTNTLDGKEVFQVQCQDFSTVLTELQVLKEFEASGTPEFFFEQLLIAAGAHNEDWPSRLLSVSTGYEGTLTYRADGIFLRQALDEIAQQMGCFWYCDSGAWLNPSHIVEPLSTIRFLPYDFTGTLAPHGINLGAPDNCDPSSALAGPVQYSLGGPGFAKILVQGKNGLLSLAGQDLPPRPDTVDLSVPAGSTQRIFPLLDGPSRILFVKVDGVNKTFAYMRAAAPETYTDEFNNPVDCLIDTTSDGTPTLKFPVGSEPAGVAGCILTVSYETESAIATADIEGRAAAFGQALGKPYSVYREKLVRRDDLETLAETQLVANNEAILEGQRPVKVAFKPKNPAWRAGNGFPFVVPRRDLSIQVVARDVSKTLKGSDGATDTIDSSVTASNIPLITTETQTAAAYLRSLRKKRSTLRIA